MERNRRFFHSMRQQLINEVIFVKNVSRPYQDAPNNLHLIDFEYKGSPCKLILNGKLKLQTKQGTRKIASFSDLIQGLIQSNYSKSKVA